MLRSLVMPDSLNAHEKRVGERQLWWLIAARLAVTLLTLATSAIWSPQLFDSAGHSISPAGAASRFGVRAILLAAVALSFAYMIALRLKLFRLQTQARAQFACDALLVTWLVWATGDIHSPYTAFYIVVTAAAAFYLGSRGALIASIGCAAAYTATTIGVLTKAIPAYAHSADAAVSAAQAIEVIGLNVVGVLVVGLLAARLAASQTRSDVQLIEATHALAKLRALHERIVESIRSGVMTTDMQGVIYTFNPAAEEITGYRAENVRGRNCSLLFGDISAQIKESLEAAREGGVSPRYEADCRTADGLALRLGYSIFPLAGERESATTDNEKRELSGLVITFQDLTQVRALELSSRRQDRLAAVGRVAAGIAHEIRNPLASMRGAIQVMRSETPDDSAQAELMEIVLRESDRLNRIITDFLTYARPQHIAPADIDLRDPLRETLALLRHSPEIKTTHSIEESLPDEAVRATADASALRQVFWNLARNALQAMPEGGALRAELQKIENSRVRITFSDTGRGMTPEQVERLFEPFSSSATGGTGLGLSIVYQIIRDHGGTINVRSQLNKGTTISIELPGAKRMRNADSRLIAEETRAATVRADSNRQTL